MDLSQKRMLAGWESSKPHPSRDDTPFLSLLTFELAVSGSGAGQRPYWQIASCESLRAGCPWRIADNQQ
jgi:hypothetical protein